MAKRARSREQKHRGVTLKSEQRHMTWPFLLAFLLGTIFGELTSDPLSDYLFFWRENQGPLSPFEQVIYWFYIPTIVYITLFVVALILAWTGRFRASWFAYIIISFAGVSLIFSLNTLGWNVWIIILMIIPLVFLVYVLERKTSLRTNRHGISI